MRTGALAIVYGWGVFAGMYFWALVDQIGDPGAPLGGLALIGFFYIIRSALRDAPGEQEPEP